MGHYLQSILRSLSEQFLQEFVVLFEVLFILLLRLLFVAFLDCFKFFFIIYHPILLLTINRVVILLYINYFQNIEVNIIYIIGFRYSLILILILNYILIYLLIFILYHEYLLIIR